MKKIEDSEPVQRLGNSLHELGETAEAKQLKELDDRFGASKEGQELEEEIDEFFGELEKHIKETPNGIHIDNEAFEDIEDEADDIEEEFKKLEKTHWAQDYDVAFHNLGNTKEAHNVGGSVEHFKKSNEGQALHKELEDLDQALDEHVKISDVPEEWKEDMFLF